MCHESQSSHKTKLESSRDRDERLRKMARALCTNMGTLSKTFTCTLGFERYGRSPGDDVCTTVIPRTR
jgi:hypothetical protein